MKTLAHALTRCLACQGNCAPDKIVCYTCWQYVSAANKKEIYAAYDNGKGQGTQRYRKCLLAIMREVRKARGIEAPKK